MEPVELFWSKYGALFQLIGFIMAVGGAVYGLWRATRDRSRDAEIVMNHIKSNTEALIKLSEGIKQFMQEATQRDKEYQEKMLEMYKQLLYDVRHRGDRRRRP
jgi:ABC-type sugar transport system substrate-binding protein